LKLLEGEQMTIEPSGFGAVHARGGRTHRLRSGDQDHKWQPLGVGAIEAEEESAARLAQPKDQDKPDSQE
jgi:hypothetical protein